MSMKIMELQANIFANKHHLNVMKHKHERLQIKGRACRYNRNIITKPESAAKFAKSVVYKYLQRKHDNLKRTSLNVEHIVIMFGILFTIQRYFQDIYNIYNCHVKIFVKNKHNHFERENL